MKKSIPLTFLITVLLAGCGESSTVTPPSPTPASSSAQEYSSAASVQGISSVAAVQASSAPQAAKTWTMAEVAEHATEQSCYTVVNGSVYDVTSFANVHKGGAEKVLALCGKDGTASFEKKHGGQEKAAATLEGLKIGRLE